MRTKIALVYDRVNKWGGAERVLLTLHEMFPEAPLYTAVYNPETAPWAKVFKMRTSFLQKIPCIKTHHEWLAPLMPLAFESFDFNGFDLIISVTSEAAKGIIVKPPTRHICYCLTPTRYLWSGEKEYRQDKSLKLLKALKIYDGLIRYLKFWDKIAAQRPDKYIAISKIVAERIEKYYNRKSELVCPPVMVGEIREIRENKGNEKQEYFLVVSRLVPYKRVDLAIKACRSLGINLKVVGTGSEMKRLQDIEKLVPDKSGPKLRNLTNETSEKLNGNIEFLGLVSDEKLGELYRNCQAVIFPGEEDFGLVPLEAQSYGKPVIAYGRGGAMETIIEGRTGLFFQEQTVESLVECLKKFNGLKVQKVMFKSEDCMANARRFDKEKFRSEFKKALAMSL